MAEPKFPKTLEQFNSFQMYIREEFKPIFKRWWKLVQTDPNFISMMVKPGAGLASIALQDHIFKYVVEKDPDFIRNLRSQNAQST